MRTPAGKECRFFYGNYHRGREIEECRLLDGAHLAWKPALCQTCPVPGILLANACPNMIFRPRLERPFPFIRQQVAVAAFCVKVNRDVQEAHIGCGECHPLPEVFNRELDDPNITP